MPLAIEPLPGRLAFALRSVQRGIEALYQLEPAPSIVPFVQVRPTCTREHVLVRCADGVVELSVVLSPLCAQALADGVGAASLDGYAEALEGVSHFVHLAERARTQLPTTLLELELQAEVDKFALLLEHLPELSLGEREALHHRLFDNVHFLHAPDTLEGARYRLANRLAAQLWARLLQPRRAEAKDQLLPRFYRASQGDKIRIACAA